MRVNNINTQPSFGIKLNENTRRILQDTDRYYKNNFEQKIDKIIDSSPISAFGGDDATVSFLETQNPYANIAPTISYPMNGIVAMHSVKGGKELYPETNEEELFERANQTPHRSINTIKTRLNSITVKELKKSLAIDYLKKIGVAFDSKSVDDKTFDRLISVDA